MERRGDAQIIYSIANATSQARDRPRHQIPSSVIPMASLQSPIIFCFLPLSLMILLFPTATVPQSTDPSHYYNLCAPSSCNNLTSLRYPYHPTTLCHHPDLIPTCVNNQYLLLASRILPADASRVLSITSSDSASSDTFRVAANSLFSCGQISRANYTTDPNIFSLLENYTYMTHLNCTRSLATTDKIHPASCLDCDTSSSSNRCYYVPGFESFPGCDLFFIYPHKGDNLSAVKDLRSFLKEGFDIRYTKPSDCQACEASGGRCGASPLNEFVCFCPSSVHPTNCSDGRAVDLSTWVSRGGGSGASKKLVAAISGSVAAVVLSLGLVAGIYIYRVKKGKQEDDDESGLDDEGAEGQMDLKDLVTGMGPTRYSYSQVTKFTSNFTNRLGEGGFGTVYKGTIFTQEGIRSHEMEVAVKVLKDSKGSEKQFMNEVATVGRIHHNNLVRLVGYCAKGKKRALVYEFMEKGSLEIYIHGTNSQSEKQQAKSGEECTPPAVVEPLSPQQLYKIAIETARGILYLHEGCRSRILHCDIKPHNVLLDSNYSAKVADFGLARMIDKDRSHVSLTGGGGTPGYAAPEIWSKSYGPITEKSDVYSYGMVLLEMAGGRKNYDAGVSASSQIYFPEWVFQRAARGELTSGRRGEEWAERVGEEEEEDGDMNILRKMCLVGLWCIQHVPSKRPLMSRVIQMLEGKAEIGTPPRPFPEEAWSSSTGEVDTAAYFLSNSTVKQ